MPAGDAVQQKVEVVAPEALPNRDLVEGLVGLDRINEQTSWIEARVVDGGAPQRVHGGDRYAEQVLSTLDRCPRVEAPEVLIPISGHRRPGASQRLTVDLEGEEPRIIGGECTGGQVSLGRLASAVGDERAVRGES